MGLSIEQIEQIGEAILEIEKSMEQFGKTTRILEERMEKRKSREETMGADLQMVLDEYISQEMMKSYSDGRFDSERKSIVSDVTREVINTIETKGKQNNNTDTGEMMPCPFCGSYETGVTSEESPRFYCKECGALGPKRNSFSHAREVWNNRCREKNNE